LHNPLPVVAPRTQPTLALIDELLAEQQRLQTPVARYSRVHDSAPAQATSYRDLIPLSAPGVGEQYAFEVDLDSCSGCKACVAGCHALNGLDDEETWRDVGLLVGGDEQHPFQQTITSACHHCADPGCLNGCPVLAYEKDPITGIVRHLDDQCIGCSYCILKCPYDVPKYSKRLGIVRKCDMCHGRLSAGEAPACVQACPTHAIRIVKVPVTAGEARPRVDTSSFLAGAPDPGRTLPTTRYVSKRPLPKNAHGADAAAPRVQPSHAPLALMFLGTQTALGLQAGSLAFASTATWLWLASLIVGSAGLVSSVFHLGRPLRAWRIFLGVRKSWLSREALAFGAWMGASALTGLLPALAPLRPVAFAVGLMGLFCSAMIYVDTGRRAWRAPVCALKFGGTAAIAALAVAGPVPAALALGAKLFAEAIAERSAPRTTILLLGHPLRRWTKSRRLLGVRSLLLLFVAREDAGASTCALVLVLIGELLEKLLFFRSVDPSRMPGMAA